ncbi:2'-5' RNA ligase family protein [Microbacterium sp. APC 3901]|uniref:2'-5' RNA ligase family protein n=1 Tax=Microbacterium sp. APC 3901 TaxID=3035192 RepID=UPI0025B558BA|nr:2'-5' RNA ligase family protein [Microbacterium sp. APC 3901]MDN3445612.1 2'-5' RNA ligase family protein [Microbacterium sp. APC 3901]
MREPEQRQSPSSIELLLDPAAETAVRAEWEALAERGLSSLARHTSASNRPHITLVARVDLPKLDPRVLADLPSFPITLGAPLLFGTGERRVLARSVVPAVELIGLRETILTAIGPGDDAPHTAPGEWMPHVALARRLRVADLAQALDLVGDDLDAHAHSVRHWDPATAVITTLAEMRQA